MFKLSYTPLNEGYNYGAQDFGSLKSVRDFSENIPEGFTLEELLNKVVPRSIISFQEFNHNNRNAESWESTHGVMIDIDSGTTVKSFINSNKTHAFYLYTSKSHLLEKDGKEGKACDRFHVLMPFEVSLTKQSILDIITAYNIDINAIALLNQNDKIIDITQKAVVYMVETIQLKLLLSTQCEYDTKALGVSRMFFPSFTPGSNKNIHFFSIYNDGTPIQWNSADIIESAVNDVKERIASKSRESNVVKLQVSSMGNDYSNYEEYKQSELRMNAILNEILDDITKTKMERTKRFSLGCCLYAKLGDAAKVYTDAFLYDSYTPSQLWSSIKSAVNANQSKYSNPVTLLEKWVQVNLHKNCVYDLKIDDMIANNDPKIRRMLNIHARVEKQKYIDSLRKSYTSNDTNNQLVYDLEDSINLPSFDAECETTTNNVITKTVDIIKQKGYTHPLYATNMTLDESGKNLVKFFNSFMFYDVVSGMYAVKMKTDPHKIDSNIKLIFKSSEGLKDLITAGVIKYAKADNMVSVLDSPNNEKLFDMLQQTVDASRQAMEADSNLVANDTDTDDKHGEIKAKISEQQSSNTKPITLEKAYEKGLDNLTASEYAKLIINKTNAVSLWTRSASRRQLMKYETIMSHQVVHPINVVNEFLGYTCDPEEGDISIFMNFIHNYITSDPEMKKILLNFIAKSVQMIKTPEIIVLSGKPGSGKSLLFDLVGKLMDASHTICREFQDLKHGSRIMQYTNWLTSKLLMLVNEVPPDATSPQFGGIWETLKQWSGQSSTTKSIFSEIYRGDYSNYLYTNIMMATNHIGNIRVDQNDRRYVVIDMHDKPFLSKPDVVEPLVEWVEGDGKKYLLHYFLNYKTEDIVIQTNKALINDQSTYSIKASYDNVGAFIDYLLMNSYYYMTREGNKNLFNNIQEQPDGSRLIPASTVYQAYNDFCLANNVKVSEIGSITFFGMSFKKQSGNGCITVKRHNVFYKITDSLLREAFGSLHNNRGVNMYLEDTKPTNIVTLFNNNMDERR